MSPYRCGSYGFSAVDVGHTCASLKCRVDVSKIRLIRSTSNLGSRLSPDIVVEVAGLVRLLGLLIARAVG
jgi:hypothetical protein